MSQDIILSPVKPENSTQRLPEFSGHTSFTTDELQRLHFTNDQLVAIWIKEVVISAIIREVLCKAINLPHKTARQPQVAASSYFGARDLINDVYSFWLYPLHSSADLDRVATGDYFLS